jgi:pilus assembly protein Flp/PilA
MLKRLFKNRKGAALIEYGLLIAGVALISAGAVSLFGHKTSDMIATVAAIIPGAHPDDNNAIISGKLIETTLSQGANGGVAASGIALDFSGIVAASATDRLGQNIGGDVGATQLDNLILEVK